MIENLNTVDTNEFDIFWMKKAIMLAKKTKEKEVPIGAILVLKNKIIGEGWNCSVSQNDPTAHAEIIALRRGGKKVKNYRLLNSSIYVTLEPCLMCIGAIIHARISRLIFGIEKKKSSLETRLVNLFFHEVKIKRKISITKGILEKSCSNQIKSFFQRKRGKKQIS